MKKVLKATEPVFRIVIVIRSQLSYREQISSLEIFPLKQITKALTSLHICRCACWSVLLLFALGKDICRCAGWSAPLLFVYNKFSHDEAHVYADTSLCINSLLRTCEIPFIKKITDLFDHTVHNDI